MFGLSKSEGLSSAQKHLLSNEGTGHACTEQRKEEPGGYVENRGLEMLQGVQLGEGLQGWGEV